VFEFKLPDLGEGIHEGEILKWYVEPGQMVEEDAPLVDVETDKAAVNIPSPRAGKIVKVQPEVGSTVEVGQVIAVIDESGGGEEAPAEEPAEKRAEEPQAEEAKREASPSEAKEAEEKPQPAPQAQPAPSTQGAPRREGPVPAAPAVRRLARELGVDINRVPGQGPAGRVRAEDVRGFASGEGAAAASPPAEGEGAAAPAEVPAGSSPIPFFELEAMPDFEALGPVEREPIRSIRRKVAKKMVTSMVAVPHVAHMDDADVTELEDFRRRERSKREGEPGGRLTLLPFVIKAVTRCLAEFPSFNASIDPFRNEIVYKGYHNVGFAADTDRGLLVPVVHGTAGKSILEISAEIERLAGKARDGSISVPEMQGGNFTITNVGPLGGTRLIPTINYPEVAILGMGRATKQPVVTDDDGIDIRVILPLTLAFDHRIADGAEAARFMNRLIQLLSDPLVWLLEG
jgi:pyruvate dehydrogenase E2 component (dihydrolipoamide acetyltransferase)